ncbi:magnesium transporter MgtE N-terminal domain-containing protein [Alkalilimnicola ehrlichii MLHE-1]|uniref:CBS domain containing protein n=1 Tax=Alkalilimnicola ehrlichii (strain ATCC BAA-1101 / DSM 17681 / MLHE-1) TaxID=187272 RepID=Q0AAG0_ALKEH|nr:CBS domain-containing protein [Alkalilimnicola ehrlichii]ABI56177.1 CBS domain containing protein [Alkalilimnicola ehrlichii MLHE-1]
MIEAIIHNLHLGRTRRAADLCLRLDVAAQVRLFSALDGSDIPVLFNRVPYRRALAIFRGMSVGARQRLLSALDPAAAARLLTPAPLPELVLALDETPVERLQAILRALPADRRKALLGALQQPSGAVGRYMRPQALAVTSGTPVAGARAKLSRHEAYVLFVQDARGRYLGFVTRSSLAGRDGRETVERELLGTGMTLSPDQPLRGVRGLMARAGVGVLPVLDEWGGLAGALHGRDLPPVTVNEVRARRHGGGLRRMLSLGAVTGGLIGLPLIAALTLGALV